MKRPELLLYRLAMVVFAALIIAILMRFRRRTQSPQVPPRVARSAASVQSNLVYKARARAMEEMMSFRPRPSPGDSDGDFWLDEAEVAAGKNPADPNSHPAYWFTINGNKDSISTIDLTLRFPEGLAADSIVVSEDLMGGSATTNPFSSEFPYMLRSEKEGLRMLHAKLLKANGAGSPLFTRGFQLFCNPPSLAFTEPSTNIVTGKRRWYLKGTASQSGDPYDWLQIRVNGDFVNDHSQGTWWSGYHDLIPGPNQFTATACNVAGLCATSSVVIYYDPALATRTPSFTCDLEETMIIGATTREISLGGTVDDNNAMVEVAVFDAVDPAFANVSVTAAQNGTNWWTVIPLPAGTNLVMVTARTSASSLNRRQYRVIRDPSFFLEITSPRAGEYINAPFFAVTGVASLNLRDASIRINGQIAEKTVTPTNITFRSTKLLQTRVDVNSLAVTADRPGHPPVVLRGR